MRISASQLNTYSFCPRMFYYRYILGIEEPPNDLMRRGLLVHAIIAEIAKGNKPDIDSLTKEFNYPYDNNVKAIIKLVDDKILKHTKFERIEERFEKEIDGIDFVGVMDALTKDGTMIDWKVVSKVKEARDPMQLAVYSKIFPAKRFKYIQLTEDKIYPIEVSQMEIDTGWLRVKTLVLKMIKKQYPMHRTRYCDRCFYRDKCFGNK